MKQSVNKSRDPKIALELIKQIKKTVDETKVTFESENREWEPWRIMEICGGQTNEIIRDGLDQVLDGYVEFIHGPGCPVCVTPLEKIDKGIAIASLPNVIFRSYGDMLRVPGTECTLRSLHADGKDVDYITNPVEAIRIAIANPDKEVVFFAVGFETHAPIIANTLIRAKELNIKNLFVLVSHVLVPPAMEVILSDEDNQVQGFLAAGHVCTVMGYTEYFPIAEKYKVPIVVTGFQLNDILAGVLQVVKMLGNGEYEVRNEYQACVREEGNLQAIRDIKKVFKIANQAWHGLGEIPNSGYCLTEEYECFNAETHFNVGSIKTIENPKCIAGDVLKGKQKPHNCPLYGTFCNPDNPQGSPMVSDEGACAAYFNYRDGGEK